MALTHFAFCRFSNPEGGYLHEIPIFESVVSEGIAPSGSNQQTTQVAPAIGQQVFCRVATDTAVYVAFGTSPNAQTAANRIFLPANSVMHCQVTVGDKGAVST